MKIKLLKFGGTATSTKNNRDYIIEIIKKRKDEKVLIVCSAMGRIGFPYATDTLLSLIEKEKITINEVSRLLSCGEVISGVVLSNDLNKQGIKCYALSIEEAGMHNQSVDNRLILKLFRKYDVLIMPGFLYLNDNNEIRTFARGGSDLSAVICAKSLDLKEVTLYKDVDGIMPYVFPGFKQAKEFDFLNYQDALALCSIGYKVIQKEALEYARKNEIEIVIKNYVNDYQGTNIGTNYPSVDIIGVSFSKDSLFVATRKIEKYKKELENCFLEKHLFVKKLTIQKTCLIFQFGINQLQIAKRLVIEKYFSNYIK